MRTESKIVDEHVVDCIEECRILWLPEILVEKSNIYPFVVEELAGVACNVRGREKLVWHVRIGAHMPRKPCT
jgi:hypothetical protein